MTLLPRERDAFERDGYFLRPGALPPETVDALTARLSELIARCADEHLRGVRPTLEFWDILRHSRDDAAVCWDTSRGPMPERADAWEARAMRVGHGLHVVDPLFGELCRSAPVGGTLAQLVPAPAAIIQSAVTYKQPRSDVVQFGLHQDAAYLTTEPESLVLAFIALDDADAENGALAVVPGTHRDPLHVALALRPDGFAPVHGAFRDERPYPQTLLPMKRGTIAFVHGRTLHGSGPNRAAVPRRALIVHAISLGSTLSPHCWVQPPPGGFMPIAPASGSSST